MGLAHPYPHSQALLWERWSGKQRSLLLGNRARLACCLMFVNGKERKTNLCKKTQQTQMESKYEAAQQISGYSSAQNSQTQTPDIPTAQFPDCVLLSYIHSWGLKQAFFSDFRRPWFPCGSPIKPCYHFLFEQDQQVGPAGSGSGGRDWAQLTSMGIAVWEMLSSLKMLFRG